MPRRREVPKRQILPDPKFGDQQIAKFINMIMRNGKKSTAEKIMYFALDNVAEKSPMDSVELMEKALENVRPMVEVKSRRLVVRLTRCRSKYALHAAIRWRCAG